MNPIRTNPGYCPDDVKGKRVVVRLRNRQVSKGDWAADTSRWSLTDDPWDIVRFRLAD